MRESDLAIFISLMAECVRGDAATVIYLLYVYGCCALVIQHDVDKYLFLDCCDWQSSAALYVQESCSDVEIKLDLFALSLFVGSR
jgi:hypothetical protein